MITENKKGIFMKRYEMFELSFQGEVLEKDWAVIDLNAAFQNGEEQVSVKGFYDGNGIYKVRFLPEKEGIWQWHISGAIKADGSAICEPNDDPNAHGVVRAVDTHFEHADGTLFRPFGTTVYAMMHQEEALIAQTFETLAAAPFNKVRYCVFPKHYDYNHNEPALYAFEKNEDGSWDVARPCIAFWQHFEKGICKLAEMGIQSDLILFHPYDRWGFSSLTMQECEVYLDYLLRRLSAFPTVWWSMANEYDICFARTTEDWHRFEDIITGNDPYRHLLGNHHCLISYDHARPKITHLSIQSANVDKAADWIKQYGKLVVYDEACYEGDLPLNWGNISAREMTRRFWMVFTAGAYCTHGEVFLSEDEVLWWAKGGVLKGQSPARIAFLKSIFDEIPGPLTEWGIFTNDMQFTPEEEKNLRRILAMRAQLSEAELDALNRKDRDCRSRCGDEVFLQYLGLHCNAVLKWKLPENHRYRVEVIDTWAMTRTVVMEAASGLTEISLPGREDMAVLAVKID